MVIDESMWETPGRFPWAFTLDLGKEASVCRASCWIATTPVSIPISSPQLNLDTILPAGIDHDQPFPANNVADSPNQASQHNPRVVDTLVTMNLSM